MQSHIAAIRNQGGEVLAISTDTVEDAARLARRRKIDFPLLADPELSVIDAYGLRHEKGGPYGDVARPAVFILDRDGRVAWRDLTGNWRVRVRPEEVLRVLGVTP